MLRDLIEHFSSLELTVANLPEDELGQGYEYLIKKFADDSGHTAAEFYTNRTVVHARGSPRQGGQPQHPAVRLGEQKRGAGGRCGIRVDALPAALEAWLESSQQVRRSVSDCLLLGQIDGDKNECK